MTIEHSWKVKAAVKAWLVREETKGKIARQKMKVPKSIHSSEQLFLYERAKKAEATAQVLRKVLKIIGSTL